MNYEEFWKLVKSHSDKLNWFYYKAVHNILRNSDLYRSGKCMHVHHLCDTEEQRKYNDEHYELWGFNEDGIFEYGKYVIFITREEHLRIHAQSEITRSKIGKASKERWSNPEYRERVSKCIKDGNTEDVIAKRNHSLRNTLEKPEIRLKMSESQKNRRLSNPVSEDTRKKLRDANLGEKNPMYGKHPSEETKQRMSDSHKLLWTDERRKEYSLKLSGENAPWFGKKIPKECRDKMSKAHTGIKQSEETILKIKSDHQLKSKIYKEYKLSGRNISWNEFQKIVSHNSVVMEQYNDNCKEDTFIIIDDLRHSDDHAADGMCNN